MLKVNNNLQWKTDHKRKGQKKCRQAKQMKNDLQGNEKSGKRKLKNH